MKRLILLLSIFLLLIFTTITKNSTKEIEKQIYNTKENLRILQQKYEMVLLDFSYLSSPEKLMEYQSKYFENEHPLPFACCSILLVKTLEAMRLNN